MKGEQPVSIYTIICKTESQWKFAVTQELKPGFCNNLEGWERAGKWKGGSGGGDSMYTYGSFMLTYGRNQTNIVPAINHLKK